MKRIYGIIPAQGSRPEIEITEEYLIAKAITLDLTFKERSKKVRIEKIEDIANIFVEEKEDEEGVKHFKTRARLFMPDKNNGVLSEIYTLEGSYRINENDICIIKDDTIQITKSF